MQWQGVTSLKKMKGAKINIRYAITKLCATGWKDFKAKAVGAIVKFIWQQKGERVVCDFSTKLTFCYTLFVTVGESRQGYVICPTTPFLFHTIMHLSFHPLLLFSWFVFDQSSFKFTLQSLHSHFTIISILHHHYHSPPPSSIHPPTHPLSAVVSWAGSSSLEERPRVASSEALLAQQWLANNEIYRALVKWSPNSSNRD